MAESTRPAEGGVTCYTSMPEAKERKLYSTSALVATTSATFPCFYDQIHDAYITAIDITYGVTGSGTAGVLDIGTAADDDALVSNHSISASAAAGTVENCTLLSTFVSTAGQSTGFYKVPAGTALLATYTTGGANNARWNVIVTYVLLDKGI